jgi:hypothetical protein
LVSKAIYVQYDLPDEITSTRPHIDFHDSFRAADGSVWWGSNYNYVPGYRERSRTTCGGCGFMVRLDPKQLDPNKRWRIYTPPPGDDFDVSGIGEDTKRHHIYFADTLYGRLGEVDPSKSTVRMHIIPLRGWTHGIYGDSQGNVWYAQIQGSTFGKYDPTTGHIWSYGFLTQDFDPYANIEDLKGNIWMTGRAKSGVAKFDPATQVLTEYKTPTLGSGPRRLSLDKKGNVWFSESAVGAFAEIDPNTGKMTEYKLPVRNISPYMMRVDEKDQNVLWGWDFISPTAVFPTDKNPYGFSPFSYNIKTNKMVYYPGPVGAFAGQTSSESNNTEWLNADLPNGAGIHFYPEGYTSDARPEP